MLESVFFTCFCPGVSVFIRFVAIIFEATSSTTESGPDTRTTPTAPRPGAVAIAAMATSPSAFKATAQKGLFAQNAHLFVNQPLLSNRQNVVGEPVQHQTSGEEEEHD